MELENELYYIAPKEPPQSRRPPAMSIGVQGWMRQNLFSSPLNSALTIITLLFVLWFLWSTVRWALFSAEWNVVTNNLRLLMVGQYDRDEIWRVSLLGLFVVFLSGLGFGLWSKALRPLLGTLVIVAVIVLLLPVGSSFLPPPAIRFIAAPDMDVNPMLFTGEAEQVVTVRVESITNADALAEEPVFVGYIENTAGLSNSRTVWNDIKAQVASESLDLSENDLAVTVELVDASGEVIGGMTSTPDARSTSFTATLPERGWYYVRTLVEESSSSGYVWVRLNGVETFTTQVGEREERIATYGALPEIDCNGSDDCARRVALRDLRFEGARTLSDYFSAQLGPFAAAVLVPVIAGVLATSAGGGLGFVIKRQDVVLRGLATRVTLLAWLLMIPMSFTVLRGFGETTFLPEVSTSVWGGLMLTVMLTVVAIVASFPIGVLLALGRASDLDVISLVCTGFIELVRGVPLITILFFAKLIVPFFFGAEFDIDQVLRMMIGLTLFTAAYIAEVVRGGLQIVPDGQIEAAQALGLSPFRTMVAIVLPQALRAVIPAIMSQYVSLFKDTTLVSIVGLFELLGIIDFIVNGQQQYRSFQREAYLFVGIVYFVLSYTMSYVSRRLEETGSGATRRE